MEAMYHIEGRLVENSKVKRTKLVLTRGETWDVAGQTCRRVRPTGQLSVLQSFLLLMPEQANSDVLPVSLLQIPVMPQPLST